MEDIFTDNDQDRQDQNSGSNSDRLLKRVLPALLVISLIAAIGSGVFYMVRYKPEVLGLSRSPEQVAPQTTKEKLADLRDTVKKAQDLMLLPDEAPELATVTSLDAVRGQEFFKNARIGDKVLIFKMARRAVLYRPSENRIIEVGVVNTDDIQGQVGGDSDEIIPSDPTGPTPTPTNQPPVSTETSSATPSPQPETPTPTPEG